MRRGILFLGRHDCLFLRWDGYLGRAFSQGETLYFGHHGIEWALPCVVRSMANLTAEMRPEGSISKAMRTDKKRVKVSPIKAIAAISNRAEKT